MSKNVEVILTWVIGCWITVHHNFRAICSSQNMNVFTWNFSFEIPSDHAKRIPSLNVTNMLEIQIKYLGLVEVHSLRVLNKPFKLIPANLVELGMLWSDIIQCEGCSLK